MTWQASFARPYKSALINRLTKSKTCASAPRPGVTRNLRWVRIGGAERMQGGLDLLVGPGIRFSPRHRCILPKKRGVHVHDVANDICLSPVRHVKGCHLIQETLTGLKIHCDDAAGGICAGP
jgi:hypothetical protein